MREILYGVTIAGTMSKQFFKSVRVLRKCTGIMNWYGYTVEYVQS